MAILRVWEGFSSTGGFLGAVIGAWMFYGYIRPRPALRHSDVIAFGFPFGWFFGRLGCGVVHDHIGGVTNFPLAMDFDHGFGPWTAGASYAEGIRHELGLYEAVLMLPIMALFLYWGQKDRVPGFFLGWFGVLYSPIRFLFEFLRNDDLVGHQDARYFGLTPAQYGMLLMFAISLAFLMSIHRKAAQTQAALQSPDAGPAPGPSAASSPGPGAAEG